jgi:hypothetical protein
MIKSATFFEPTKSGHHGEKVRQPDATGQFESKMRKSEAKLCVAPTAAANSG